MTHRGGGKQGGTRLWEAGHPTSRFPNCFALPGKRFPISKNHPEMSQSLELLFTTPGPMTAAPTAQLIESVLAVQYSVLWCADTGQHQGFFGIILAISTSDTGHPLLLQLEREKVDEGRKRPLESKVNMAQLWALTLSWQGEETSFSNEYLSSCTGKFNRKFFLCLNCMK